MYAEWRACERLGILPSGLASNWDENLDWRKAQIIAYSQIREYEDAERETNLQKMIAIAMGAKNV